MLLIAATLSGCAGNGDGLDANGRPLVAGDPGTGPLIATFESIQAHVFTPICTACHAGGGAPQGLRLDAESSYDLLVGVPSSEQPSTLRVKPGDPDGSYLIQKLEGRAAVGARMPLGGPYLDQATIDVIRQWITDGAQRSATAVAADKPFALTMTAPRDGDVLDVAPRQMVLGFSRELDRTRLDSARVTLERIDPTAERDVTTEVAIQSIATDANPSALVVLPRAGLTPGRYRLRVDTASLADLDGDVLPGRANAAELVISFEIGADR